MTALLACSCLCGAVRFDLPQPRGPVTACHCRDCRKSSGHYAASFAADEAALGYTAREGLAGFTLPSGATRGFCRICGSSLWFRARDGSFAVEAGAVDGATGLALAAHIFTASRGDYYRLDDGVPHYPGDADVD